MAAANATNEYFISPNPYATTVLTKTISCPIRGRLSPGRNTPQLHRFYVRRPQAAQVLLGYRLPRLERSVKRTASSAALNRARALNSHSCCSALGAESATTPAPACT